jgi:hypothetical protein
VRKSVIKDLTAIRIVSSFWCLRHPSCELQLQHAAIVSISSITERCQCTKRPDQASLAGSFFPIKLEPRCAPTMINARPGITMTPRYLAADLNRRGEMGTIASKYSTIPSFPSPQDTLERLPRLSASLGRNYIRCLLHTTFFYVVHPVIPPIFYEFTRDSQQDSQHANSNHHSPPP